MDLSINRADRGERTVMTLGGEIDVYTAPFVRERLDEAVHAGRVNLIVDMTGVRFLDSTGLGVLVGRLKLTRSLGGSFRIVGTDTRVLKVFAITGLDKVFEIYPTLAEAVAAAEAEAEPDDPSPVAGGLATGSVDVVFGLASTGDAVENADTAGGDGASGNGPHAGGTGAERAATSAGPGDRGT
nr:STAS domain-containing protein [Intrasporangium sp.]